MSMQRKDVYSIGREGWTVAPDQAAAHLRANGPSGKVRIGDLWIPAAFEYVVSSIHAEHTFLVALMYAIEDGEIHLRMAYSPTHELNEALAILRKLSPITRWKREALMYLAAEKDGAALELIERVLNRPATYSEMSRDERGDVIGEAIRTAARTPLRRRRDRITDDLLREVAQVYRAANDAGEAPTMAVAQHFYKSHSSAARWVGLAREAGHLGQADGSRGGEVNV